MKYFLLGFVVALYLACAFAQMPGMPDMGQMMNMMRGMMMASGGMPSGGPPGGPPPAPQGDSQPSA